MNAVAQGKAEEYLCKPDSTELPYSGKIWRALNLAKWQKKGCILILLKFKFGDLELYL